jgi:DNA repair exonuclease SbcCD nuclease subunit
VSTSTFRALYVGDPHAEAATIVDCQNLIDLVAETAKVEKADVIVNLGDSYHTHGVIALEVLAFWRHAFAQLAKTGAEVIALVGNHDQSGAEGSDSHSLMAHLDQIHAIDKAKTYRGVRWVPYIHDAETFYKACQEEVPSPLLVCHATFQGGTYDNGFYAADGFDPARVPQKQILSGHIHSPQEFGKVWYPGAPRWRTKSDANIERHIWVVDHFNGAIVSKKGISTGGSCRVIYEFEDTPEDPVMLAGYDFEKDDIRVCITGPSEYVDARKLELAPTGVKLRTVKTDSARTKVRESEGVDKAFLKFVDAYVPQHGAAKPRLEALVRARLT